MLPAVATLCGVAAAWSAVALVGPDDSGPPLCPWRAVTGLDCPFCGATRSAAALASGDLVAALSHNALFVVALPAAALAWLAWARASWRARPAPQPSNRAWAVLGAVTLAWWAIRLVVPWLGSGG